MTAMGLLARAIVMPGKMASKHSISAFANFTDNKISLASISGRLQSYRTAFFLFSLRKFIAGGMQSAKAFKSFLVKAKARHVANADTLLLPKCLWQTLSERSSLWPP